MLSHVSLCKEAEPEVCIKNIMLPNVFETGIISKLNVCLIKITM